MSTPTLLDTPLDNGTYLKSTVFSKTQISDNYVRPAISGEMLSGWDGFNKIPAAGSTLDAKPHAQAQKTLPISKEEKEIVAFKLLEAWTGRVEEVNELTGMFSAQVASEHQSGILETAEFTFEEISEDDIDLIRPGALFYWSIGYQVDKFGRRSTQSSLRFKRGKYWTRKEKEHAAKNPMVDLEWLKSDLSQGTNGAA